MDCEDVVTAGCKKDIYASCLWHFSVLSRHKDSGTTAESSHIEPTSYSLDACTLQFDRPSIDLLEMEERCHLLLNG